MKKLNIRDLKNLNVNQIKEREIILILILLI